MREGKPWCLLEAKLSDGLVENHHHRHASALVGIPMIQLTQEPKVIKRIKDNIYRIAASRFFS